MNSLPILDTETVSTPTFVGFHVANEADFSLKDALALLTRENTVSIATIDNSWWSGFQFNMSCIFKSLELCCHQHIHRQNLKFEMPS